jgi:hypothetical protein
MQFIKDRAECANHIQIGLLVPASDIVRFAEFACIENTPDGRTVIPDIEPVADLLAITVDRQRLKRKCIEDAQGNELFREMEWPVIVRAIGGQNRQAVGVMVAAKRWSDAALLAE